MIITTENIVEIITVIGNCIIGISTIIKAKGYAKKFESYCTRDGVIEIIEEKIDTIKKISDIQFKSIEQQLISLDKKFDEFKDLILSNKLKLNE